MSDMSNNFEVSKMSDGIYNLDTIRFGKIPEIMIKLLKKYSYAVGTSEYDLLNKNEKIEVKFSIAREMENDEIDESNVLSVCINNSELRDRRIEKAERCNSKFDCNIQQIKPDLFDILIYGVFFKDSIVIFEMNSKYIQDNFNLRKSNIYKELVSKLNRIDNTFKKLSDETIKKSDKTRIKKQLKGICSLSIKDIKVENPIITKSTINKFKAFEKKLELDFDKNFKKYKKFVESINDNIIPNLSPNQHKGNKNEGQFHINNENIDWHEKHNESVKWITYDQLYILLKEKELKYE